MSDISIEELETDKKTCSKEKCYKKAAFKINMPEGDNVFLCYECVSNCFHHIIKEDRK